ncbi:MAG: hypothetical protein ACREUP_15185, partial [Burkholderiales bacterium]
FVVRDEAAGRSLVIDSYDQMRILEESTRPGPHRVLPGMEPPVMPPLGPESKPAANPGAAGNPDPVSSPTPAP